MSASAYLRARTTPCHDQVDAAFGGFRLDRPSSYRAFLIAHARALAGAETALAGRSDLPAWRARMPLLSADLADLRVAPPPPLAFTVEQGAAAWGALYVIEGSRLGGAMLARQVSAALPRRYLDAAFAPGDWRALRQALDGEADRHGSAWLETAVSGAEACFALYQRAAALAVEDDREAKPATRQSA